MLGPVNVTVRRGFRFAPLFTILFLLSTGVAHAVTGQETITFKGGLHNTLTGACNTTAYNSICPSTTCHCEEYEGFVVTGNLIGKVTNPEPNYPAVGIDIIVDNGNRVGSNAGGCAPIFASLFVVGSKDTQQLEFNGSYCDPLGNQSAPGAKSPISGGFGIEQSTVGYTGFGTVSGSVGFNSGSIKLTFKGPATH